MMMMVMVMVMVMMMMMMMVMMMMMMVTLILTSSQLPQGQDPQQPLPGTPQAEVDRPQLQPPASTLAISLNPLDPASPPSLTPSLNTLWLSSLP